VSLRSEVIRVLIDEYQAEPNTVAFSRILERVDELLLWTIHKYVRQRQYLLDVPLLDLYHSAIVGLGRAIKTMLPDEDENQVNARIIAYVRNEIRTNYPLSPEKQDYYFKRLDAEKACLRIESERDSTESIEMAAQLSMLRDEYAQLISSGYITEDEWVMFVEHYAKEDSFKVIGDRRGKHAMWAKRKIDNIMARIQDHFANYDI
jgi:hypothetical protein